MHIQVTLTCRICHIRLVRKQKTVNTYWMYNNEYKTAIKRLRMCWFVSWSSTHGSPFVRRCSSRNVSSLDTKKRQRTSGNKDIQMDPRQAAMILQFYTVAVCFSLNVDGLSEHRHLTIETGHLAPEEHAVPHE